ncbi:MAG: multicopper oxidase domain-containing protein [Bacteroidia bacterium]|nr:multicopper oxidase domain-containing protein [Bacteroidia bacterium]
MLSTITKPDIRISAVIFLLLRALVPTALSQNALQIPDTLSGTKIDLDLRTDSFSFYPGFYTQTMGVNSAILGPTLFLNKGDLVKFSVKNSLPDTTTLHWHGLHVSSSDDGGPHTIIAPGTTWSPEFRILNRAATYWYHPHLHHKTDKHVSKGISGLLIVRDQFEAKLPLPRSYGSDDFPMVIQTKDFDTNKEILIHSNNDDVVMVNATIEPFLKVGAQVIRCRVLNGSSQRTFNLGLTDNHVMYLIASDGGLLNKPESVTRLMLSPGERAEILIDFSEDKGKKIALLSYASELANGIYGASNPGMGPGMNLTGYKPNVLNGTDFNVLEFKIGAPTANPITQIPNNLINNTRIPESQSDITRNLLLSPRTMGMNQLNGGFLINNQKFSPTRIDYRIPINNTEIWSIRNMSGIAHPFHIHDVQFFILDRNGMSPSSAELGLKDVVLIRPQETVRFITKFEDFADTTVPYMFHCHMLTHEDDGMMEQFIVFDTSQTLSFRKVNANRRPITYPNPVYDSKIFLNSENNTTVKEINLYSVTGEKLTEVGIFSKNTEFVIEIPLGLNGWYFLEVVTESTSSYERVLINN